ncbi:hypothetical protein NBRC10512_005522 [Rhodotorula toruloides]|uniref:RHTO0S09e03532g1_1 n=2 Tax=Rhodotorula toruloides TaxID=5286 RepID=A0A061B3J3_RHOTO|nr:uncharacterized protein RHTO_07776 [Rhodotorula toruloides NP11]EMS22906.1 hypothetical protein RHTO_07776 [Rhodotorula toruloides NP11]CDR44395.1 RHTO0S09e03532g1_1 [Rhodotorula toruloides]
MSSHASPVSLPLAPSQFNAQGSSHAFSDTHAHLHQLQRSLLQVQTIALKLEELRNGQVDETSRLSSLEDKLQAIVCGTVDQALDKSAVSARAENSPEADVAERISKLATQVSVLSTAVSRLHARHLRRRTLKHRYEHI